jgi:hypothetical protein
MHHFDAQAGSPISEKKKDQVYSYEPIGSDVLL